MVGGVDPIHSADAVRRMGGRPRAGIWLHLLFCGLMKNKAMPAAIVAVLLLLVGGELMLQRMNGRSGKISGEGAMPVAATADSLWQGPDSSAIPAGSIGELIRYGRDLIARTGYYYGPAGIISRKQNGMNCQNCHLDAGRQPWGNNFGGVRSSYPKFKERRGAVEDIAQRIA